MASSLRGDVASSLDEGSDSEGLEIEPNDSLEHAPHLSLPAMIKGDTFQSDSRAELRFYDPEVEQWRFVALHDIYRFTVSEQRPVTITLSSEGGTNADLNLLLITPSEANNVDPIYIDGQELELVKLSTKSDPVETITTMLTPGDYFVGIQAFLTRARTDYILTIE